MTTHNNLEPTYVLHYRAYRDTSLLLNLFTEQQGHIHVIARGARRPRSPQKGLLQPFSPLLTSWRGRGELYNLSKVEPNGTPAKLANDALMTGFYINELILRLTAVADPLPNLFRRYQQVLLDLQQEDFLSALRLFERDLLQCLGYGLQLEREALSGDDLQPEANYYYELEQGPIKTSSNQTGMIFSGASLQALKKGVFNTAIELQQAKLLLRTVLDTIIGAKPLKTRLLAQSLNKIRKGEVCE